MHLSEIFYLIKITLGLFDVICIKLMTFTKEFKYNTHVMTRVTKYVLLLKLT